MCKVLVRLNNTQPLAKIIGGLGIMEVVKKVVPKRILIIEDEKSLRQVVRNKLEAESFVVSVSSNGDNILKAITQDNPDLILMDLMLPKTDGLILLKTIRENSDFNDVKIIVLSNFSQETDVAEILKLGATEFLVKADTPLSELVKVIRRHLD